MDQYKNIFKLKNNEKWHKICVLLQNLDSSLGDPILESGIKDAVFVFNYFGIETFTSCEGHTRKENQEKLQKSFKKGLIKVYKKGERVPFCDNGRRTYYISEGGGITKRLLSEAPVEPYIAIKDRESVDLLRKELGSFYNNYNPEDKRRRLILEEDEISILKSSVNHPSDNKYISKNLSKLRSDILVFADFLASKIS